MRFEEPFGAAGGLRLYHKDGSPAYESRRDTVEKDPDFLQSVGHDLRGELNTIVTATLFVLRYDADLKPKYRDMLERVANASKRFELMLNEFGDAAWMGNGTWPKRPDKELVLEPVKAAQLVEGLLERLKVVITTREVAVEVDVPEDLPAFRADREQSTNAIEYVLDLALARSVGKTVRIHGHLVDGQTTISISDDGEIVDPSLVPDLLEPFKEKKLMPKPVAGQSKQLPGLRKRLGLGLAIARGLFTAQGGGLSVEIKPEGGLTIHCVVGHAEAASAAGLAGSPSPG